MRRASDRTAWPLILVFVGAGVVSAGQVGKAPIALEQVRADLGLSLAAGAWLLSAFALVGALAGVAIGLLADRLGPRRVLVAALLAQAAGGLAGAVSTGVGVLLASRVVEGLGFLMAVVAAPALVAAAARPETRDRAMAVWATFMPVGMTLAMLAAPVLEAVGWRAFWQGNAALLAGYALLVALATRGLAGEGPPGATPAVRIGAALGAPGPWLLAALFAAFAGAYFALFSFLPALLASRLGVGPSAAGVLTGVAVALSAGGNLAGGALLGAGVRRTWVLAAAFAVLGLTGAAVFAWDAGWASYGLCLVFSAASGLIPTCLLAAAPDHAPRPELLGATVGLMMQGNNAGLLLAPVAAGALAEAAGWPAVAGLVAAVVAIGVALVWRLGRQTAELRRPG